MSASALQSAHRAGRRVSRGVQPHRNGSGQRIADDLGQPFSAKPGLELTWIVVASCIEMVLLMACRAKCNGLQNLGTAFDIKRVFFSADFKNFALKQQIGAADTTVLTGFASQRLGKLFDRHLHLVVALHVKPPFAHQTPGIISVKSGSGNVDHANVTQTRRFCQVGRSVPVGTHYFGVA